MPAVFCWICASTWVTASPHAARTMSCNISTSPATSGSILTLSRFFWPSMVTVTMPPPAVALTLISAISCCIFSCICCAWRIICCIFTLPGSFTFLLLEVANFAYFAAEDFAETPHFRVGKRAARDFVLGFGFGWRGNTDWRHGARRRPRARFWGGELQAQRPAEDCLDGLLEATILKIQRVGFRRHHIQVPANDGEGRILHGVGQVGVALFVQPGVQALARVARDRRRRFGLRRERVGARGLRIRRPHAALLGAIQFERRRAGTAGRGYFPRFRPFAVRTG